MKLNARTPKAGGLCCRRVHTLVQPTFIGDPDSASCPVDCLEGLGYEILGVSNNFVGAGWYFDANTSNFVRLNASEVVEETVACGSGYANAYPPDFLPAYADGGPLGPWYFSGVSWIPIIQFAYIGGGASEPATEIFMNPVFDSRIIDTEVYYQFSSDGGATWGTNQGPLTALQISGTDPVLGPQGSFRIRLVGYDTDGCEYLSAALTFFES